MVENNNEISCKQPAGHTARPSALNCAPEPVQGREKPAPLGGHALEEPDDPFPVPQRAQRLRNSDHVAGGDLLNEPPLADKYIPHADNLRNAKDEMDRAPSEAHHD